jgi:hypothetical protein
MDDGRGGWAKEEAAAPEGIAALVYRLWSIVYGLSYPAGCCATTTEKRWLSTPRELSSRGVSQ